MSWDKQYKSIAGKPGKGIDNDMEDDTILDEVEGCCFPDGSDGKASACSAGDLGSIPGLGRSPGEGNGNPLQHPCLESPMDRGAWWATVHRVSRSQTRLSDLTFTQKAVGKVHSKKTFKQRPEGRKTNQVVLGGEGHVSQKD